MTRARKRKKRGNIPIEFVDKTRVTRMVKGEMKTISSVRPALEKLYYTFFKMRCKRTRKSDLQLVYNVEMIVWGALHLEAMVNLICTEWLGYWLIESPGAGDPVWENVKLAKIHQKLEMLCQGMEINKGVAKRMVKRLSRVTNFRNRLVHFKEPPVKVRDRSFITHMLWYGQKGKLPEPPLITELKSPCMTQLRDDILKLSKWLNTLTFDGGMQESIRRTMLKAKAGRLTPVTPPASPPAPSP